MFTREQLKLLYLGYYMAGCALMNEAVSSRPVSIAAGSEPLFMVTAVFCCAARRID